MQSRNHNPRELLGPRRELRAREKLWGAEINQPGGQCHGKMRYEYKRDLKREKTQRLTQLLRMGPDEKHARATGDEFVGASGGFSTTGWPDSEIRRNTVRNEAELEAKQSCEPSAEPTSNSAENSRISFKFIFRRLMTAQQPKTRSPKILGRGTAAPDART